MVFTVTNAAIRGVEISYFSVALTVAGLVLLGLSMRWHRRGRGRATRARTWGKALVVLGLLLFTLQSPWTQVFPWDHAPATVYHDGDYYVPRPNPSGAGPAGCFSEGEILSGKAAGAYPIEGPLRPSGWPLGPFGGPPLFAGHELNSPGGSDLMFAEVSPGCYKYYVFIGL